MYSEAVLYRILSETPGTPLYPSIEDRAAWQAVQTHPAAQLALDLAAEAAGQPVPFLPATLYLDCDRTGNRLNYETPCHERRRRLTAMAIAECLVNDGRYVDDMIDLIWAICEESTWCTPAHAPSALPDVDDPYLELYGVGTSVTLCEIDHLLGDRLPAVVRKRIRYECNKRIIQPYLVRTDWWWHGGMRKTNNWNAVCNHGAAATTLHLCDDVMVQAQVLAKAIASVPNFLESFDEDGCSSEGAGYWGYGFGHYAALARHVYCRTEGKIDLLEGERFVKICRFPATLELSPGKFATFSDCDEDALVPAGVCEWLAAKCDAPALGALGRRHLERLVAERRADYLLKALFLCDVTKAPLEGLPATAFYGGFQWLISRAKPASAHSLVLAAKGGHNAEDHNHNDVGQFIIHYQGESLIVDLGRQNYTKQFFGPQRYEFLECRSFGHGVPVVNGVEQRDGLSYASQLLRTEFEKDRDLMEIDMTGAYPAEAGLSSLKRRFALRRTYPHGLVEIIDTFSFADGPGVFESRLHTFGTVEEAAPCYLRITGRNGAVLGVHIDGCTRVELESVEPEANSRWTAPLTRIRIIARGQSGQVALRFTPE